MKRFDNFRGALTVLAAAGICWLGLLSAASAASPAPVVTVPGTTDFPESMAAATDGSLFFSGFAGGRIFRAAPGEATASEWVKQGTNGLSTVLGVQVNDKAGLLYACSNDASWAGVKIPTGNTPTALKIFDLKTAEPKGSIPLPASTLFGQTPLCNDIEIAADGSLYVTDSLAGHILRLKPGASAFEIWAHDPRWDVKGPQLDGIAVLPDGNVYANIFEGDGLYRISVNPDGSAGAIVKLETSRPLYHSDGLRAYGANKLLMVEGETKGFLDLITLSGDKAQIETVKSGFLGPVSLYQVGKVVYVQDTPLSFLFDPKGRTPPPFTATAVPAP